ncbi:MFS transporter [Arthrobacter sp. H35-D1]|uniref:MFS transporter n=1 Tax=Arthrobacter sp. H35-D1 TaxID=3046202 RepID=UPI0032D581A1
MLEIRATPGKKAEKEKLSPSLSPQAPASAAPAIKGGRYSVLPRLAGPGYIPLGLFARVPLAMLTIGVLTMVTFVSNSYAIGGFAAGSIGIGAAVGAPVVGYLADHLGQKRVLLVAAVVNALLVAAVVVLAYSLLPRDGAQLTDGSTVVVLLTAFLAGGSSPQVGPLSRVRWMALSKRLPAKERAPMVDTALSLEGTADEVTFVLGPALVGLLASLVAPWLPLVLAAVMTAVLVTLFALHPTAESVSGRPVVGSMVGNAGYVSKERPKWLLVAVPVAAMVCMGTFFGSAQTALTAFTGVYGSVDQAGLMYAIMGASSAATALSVAYWPVSFSNVWRWVLTAGMMAAGSVAFLAPSSLGQMAWVLLLVGLPVGPAMVTIFSVGSVVAPPQWMGTVMTVLASGIVGGTALGSALSGALAETSGYHTAFIVPIIAATTLFLLGLLAAVVLRRQLARVH